MKRTLKMMAMLLCVAAFASLSSCSKDNEDNQGGNRNLSINELVGKWQCTWSTSESYYNLQENAYVGAVWEFESPDANYMDADHGIFIVRINGSTYTGRYSFWGSNIDVYVNEDNPYSYFNADDEYLPKMYDIIKDSNNTISLKILDGEHSRVALKFKKIS